MKPVRIGVLGTGTVVRGYHLPALLANPRAQVVAVGNLHSDSLHALARDFGIAKTYSDFDRMADDPEIDAVVNALPSVGAS
jgi:predicted dehydrogenase